MKTKITLITGGSRGLSKEMTYSLLKKGTDVIMRDISLDDIEKLINNH